mgnify:CR=1 FL=1
MTQATIPTRVPSRLQDLREQAGRIPFIRRKEFTYGSLAGLAVFAVLFLPRTVPLTPAGMAVIALLVVGSIAWAAIFFSDELKPEWSKTLTAFALLILFGFLYYRYSTAHWSRMMTLFMNMEVIKVALPRLLEGLVITVKIAISSWVISTLLGLFLAVFRAFDNRVLNIFIIAYVDVFRAIPIMVLMVVIYFALPYVGLTLDAMTSAILALGLNSAAYVAEIFRGGIMSVKKGQIEAARALGLNTWQTMRLVLLPQAIRVVMPPLVGNYVASAKDTALASSISVIEMMKAALVEQAMLANPSPLIFCFVLYLLMFVPLTRLSSILEQRMKKSQRKANV